MCVRCSFTDGDEHAQLALARILRVDVELHGEAGRDAAGQARTAGSHFAGVVSRQNPELEGAADMQVRMGVINLLHPESYANRQTIRKLWGPLGENDFDIKKISVMTLIVFKVIVQL